MQSNRARSTLRGCRSTPKPRLRVDRSCAQQKTRRPLTQRISTARLRSAAPPWPEAWTEMGYRLAVDRINPPYTLPASSSHSRCLGRCRIQIHADSTLRACLIAKRTGQSWPIRRHRLTTSVIIERLAARDWRSGKLENISSATATATGRRFRRRFENRASRPPCGASRRGNKKQHPPAPHPPFIVALARLQRRAIAVHRLC